jgi:hypothetical protein
MYGTWWTGVARRRLTVSRHNLASLTNADADRILGDATTVLRTNDGPGDVACSVTLERSGNVGVFSTGDGSIGTQAELNAVLNLPGNAKIVDDVDFCRGSFNTSIVGCGDRPGKSFVIERFNANEEGIGWAHEFGHNQNLRHRDTSSDNLMFFSLGTNRRRVNQTECNAFRGPQWVAISIAMSSPYTAVSQGAISTPGTMGDQMLNYATGGRMPGEQMPRSATGERMLGEQMPEAAARAKKVPVDEFVSQIYFDGLPLDKAAGYGDESVDPLIAILRDPSRRRYHENAALTLGMIGSERAVEPLIAYIQNRREFAAPQPVEPEASRAAHKGRVGAVMGLGYIVYRGGSKTALNFLKDNATLEMVRRLGMDDTSSDEVKKQDLTKYFLLSLGISGNVEAAAHLKRLQQQVTGADWAPRRKTKSDEILAKGLELHAQIVREGLLNYYASEKGRVR